MGRGQKSCAKCGTVTGPRTHVCIKCHTPFTFKGEVQEPASKVLDWKTLIKGDLIKVVNGSGSFFKTNDGRIPMGYSGIFRVSELHENGIHAYPVKAGGEHGHCFIWMGARERSPTGIIRKAHKIRKVLKLKKKNKVKK